MLKWGLTALLICLWLPAANGQVTGAAYARPATRNTRLENQQIPRRTAGQA
ncbi:MAG: hypothetical protein U5P41_10170 [Gammaproteobacteria bacterium]|nr:hypothetical protein [Gammaproteobacteria bacterium]